MSLRIEENWEWSIKTFPHTLRVVSTSDETAHCGILFDFKRKPALRITGGSLGQKLHFLGTIFLHDNIFIERKDDILLSCKHIFNC